MRVPQFLRRHRIFLLTSLAVASCILLLRFLGLLQIWELEAYDRLLQLRPTEHPEDRIVIVGINETDLQTLGQALVTDQVMAELLNKIKAQGPRVIGLDLYRNLPIEPGHDALMQVFASTPNLIGIQKLIGDQQVSTVPGNSVLARADRLAASDIVVDVDGKVRRGLLYPSTDSSTVLESLSLRVALEYLAAKGITPDMNAALLKLQQVVFPRFEGSDGGYVRADAGGYQILLNPRRVPKHFQTVSASDILRETVPSDLMKDRIVMIGSTAAGDSDVFFTSYSSGFGGRLKPVYGVELHTDFVSQILSAVLNQRPLIHVFPKELEFAFVLLAAYLGGWINAQRLRNTRRIALTLLSLLAVFVLSYLLLVVGWWFPLIPTCAAIGMAAVVRMIHEARRLRTLSSNDELTQVANRRTLNEYLRLEWSRCLRSQTPLSLILCDVDYFKLYNDTYGHPQGDECLRQVAKALKHALKRPTDLVARYGGEEFVVVLPQTNAEGAIRVAETIQAAVRSLKVSHRSSKVSEFITLSMGVASLIPSPNTYPDTLLNRADLALYEAKQQGRNRVVLQQQSLT